MTSVNPIRFSRAARAITLAAAVAVSAPGAFAQDQQSPMPAEADAAQQAEMDRVLATVNGQPITIADLSIAAEEYIQQFGRQPPLEELLNIVINLRVISEAAEAAGFADRDEVKQRLEIARAEVLRDAYLRDGILNAVSEEDVKARYDEEVADFEPQDERRLRHILVETEDEAKQIIADIEAGGDFAEIAKEKSKDPGSGPNGGDLDFVPRGATVPPFEQAAFALEVDETTKEPVQSQFGWHIIRLEEIRESSPPEFESQADRIRGEMQRDYFVEEVTKLRDAADIEVATPDGAAEDQDGDASQSEAPAQ